MKVAELKKYLDERFIKYPKKAKKPYLQKLFDSLKKPTDLNPSKRIKIVDKHVYVSPQESVDFETSDPIGEYYTDKKGITRVGIPEMPVYFNVPRIMTKEEEENLPFYLAREKRLKEEEEFLRQVETRALRKNITPQQAKSQLHQLEVNMTHHPIEDPVREWRVKGPMTISNEFKQEDELDDRILLEATKADVERETMEGAEAETRGYEREKKLAKKVISTLKERVKRRKNEILEPPSQPPLLRRQSSERKYPNPVVPLVPILPFPNIIIPEAIPSPPKIKKTDLDVMASRVKERQRRSVEAFTKNRASKKITGFVSGVAKKKSKAEFDRASAEQAAMAQSEAETRALINEILEARKKNKLA
jgi:hypothetical protein